MTDTRQRILDVSTEMFRRRGYEATGINGIITAAEATSGSLYHFFPGGKQQLGEETIRWSGYLYGQLIPAVFDPAPDVASAVEDFFTGAAEHLESTDYADACPIATVALEIASTDDRLRQATAEVFESWIDVTSERFSDAGIENDQAKDLAVAVLAALEGAFILSRSQRSTNPIKEAGAVVADAVRAAIP